MTMLGGSLGCFAAIVLVCAGLIGFSVWKKTQDEREDRNQPQQVRP